MTIAISDVKKYYLFGGLLEKGTFTLSGTVTSGTITADAKAKEPTIAQILAWGFASDSDTAVDGARDVADNTIKITTATTDDTGDYWIWGRTA